MRRFFAAGFGFLVALTSDAGRETLLRLGASAGVVMSSSSRGLRRFLEVAFGSAGTAGCLPDDLADVAFLLLRGGSACSANAVSGRGRLVLRSIGSFLVVGLGWVLVAFLVSGSGRVISLFVSSASTMTGSLRAGRFPFADLDLVPSPWGISAATESGETDSFAAFWRDFFGGTIEDPA